MTQREMAIFHTFPTEKIVLKKTDGTIIKDGVTALISMNVVIIEDMSLSFHEGDIIERRLPNGTTDTYEIIDTGYQKGLDEKILPEHFQTKVRKLSSLDTLDKRENKPNVEIHNTFQGSVHDLQLQQFSSGSTQINNHEESVIDYQKLEEIIKVLSLGITDSKLSKSDNHTLKLETKKLKAAVKRKENKPIIIPILKTIYSIIKNIPSNVVAGILVAKILPLLPLS